MSSVYEIEKEKILYIEKIIDSHISNYDRLEIIVSSIYEKDLYNYPYFIIAVYRGDSLISNIALFIETDEWNRKNIQKIVCEISRNSDIKMCLLLSYTKSQDKEKLPDNFVLIKRGKREIYGLFYNTLYHPFVSKVDEYINFSTKGNEIRREISEVINKVGKVLIFSGKSRLLKSLFLEIYNELLNKFLRASSITESMKQGDFLLKVKISDYDKELESLINKHFNYKEMYYECLVSVETFPCNYSLLKDNGDIGRIFVDYGTEMINIEDLIHSVSKSDYDEYASEFRSIILHTCSFGKKSASEVLKLSNYLPFFTDVFRIMGESGRCLYTDYGRLIEALEGLSANLMAYYTVEKELSSYNPEKPGKLFLPKIQNEFLNSIRNVLTSWYIVMGSIALMYSHHQKGKEAKISTNSVKKQINFYKENIINAEDVQFLLLEQIREIRSTVIEHPANIGSYSWITANYHGLGYLCFFARFTSNDKIIFDLNFANNVYEKHEFADGCLVQCKQEDLFKKVFPVPHPNRIYLATLDLIKAIFLDILDMYLEKA